jgi:uncharacterized protein (TIGR02444 family)
LATEFPDGALWRYAVAVYARPGVAAACLELQARHGLDVNLMLYGLWVGAERGVALSDGEWRRAEKAVRPWHRRAVRGLRGVRVNLKALIERLPGEYQAVAAAIRTRVKAVELDSEHLELLMLEAIAPEPRTDGRFVLHRNAKACVQRSGDMLDRRDLRLIRTLSKAGGDDQ